MKTFISKGLTADIMFSSLGGSMQWRNMIEASCHCGNVILAFSHPPESLTRCNCSLCYRYNALWGDYSPEDVDIFTKESSKGYCSGDKTLDVFHCVRCGCVTHYITKPGAAKNVVAVNFNMVEKVLRKGIEVRNFDGAETFKYLPSGSAK